MSTIKKLSGSYVPADRSVPILDMSVDEALRASAAKAPDRIALVEIVPEGHGSLVGASSTEHTWTYAGLLAEAEVCAPPPVTDLERYCRENLARHNTPQHWSVVDDFQTTGSGKVQRFRLQEMKAAGELQSLDPAQSA